MTAARGATSVRARRAEIVADASLRGRAFGAALATLVDEALAGALTGNDLPVAVVGLGSYARRELCPASDVDVLLVHAPGVDVSAVADALWYPLWDAGFVLGHAARDVKQTRRLLAKDRDTLTALLEGRVVAATDPALGADVIAAARAYAVRERAAIVEQLAADSVLRRLRPGPIAEMLEPDLKDGAGGLRDLQALDWAGWCLGGPGTVALVADGALAAEDAGSLADARRVLLDVRVALHRVAASRSDVLALQEQDAVAVALARHDADVLVRDLAAATRRTAWIVDDVWSRLRRRDRRGRPTRPVVHDLEPGVAVIDGRVVDDSGVRPDGNRLLRLARVAAEHGATIDRATLRNAREASPPRWDDDARHDLVAFLRTGRAGVDVVAALDLDDLMTRLLPEWAHVRSRPQRNAYHRFTIDRHLMETVAEAASLLDDPGGPNARPVAGLERPDVLLLGALLHDIGKGRKGDHSAAGAALAGAIGTRIGLDVGGVSTLSWLVQDHLAMADTATRRDLSDPVTIERFAARVGDIERLRLLALLTVADSLATGPAAWSTGKAQLIQELYDRTVAHWAGEPSARPCGGRGRDPRRSRGGGRLVRPRRRPPPVRGRRARPARPARRRRRRAEPRGVRHPGRRGALVAGGPRRGGLRRCGPAPAPRGVGGTEPGGGHDPRRARR